MWLKILILHLCPKLYFPSRRQFSQEILLRLVEKINLQYVLPTFANCFSTTTSFDLWMFKGTYDVFALMTIFLSND
jgi:hypothetical protein